MIKRHKHLPLGIKCLAVFLGLGSLISLTACLSLFFPKSPLAGIWLLNPHAHTILIGLGYRSVLILAPVALLCATASIGLWRRVKWGYYIAVALITINLLGDITNVVLGTEPRAAAGIPIAALILLYLLRRSTRDFFR